MVDIVSGQGLGLVALNTVGNIHSVEGQSEQHLAVNTANGNLIVQHQDEFLFGRNLNSELIRTYNSRGQFDDDNQDNFRFNVNRRIYDLVGEINQQDSAIKRVAGDGSVATFYWNDQQKSYWSTEGDGAHDTLVFNGKTWLYTEGSSLIKDVYDWNGETGRVVLERDREGNELNFSYHANGFVSNVSDNLGNQILIQYQGNQALSIEALSRGKTTQTLSYTYDDLDRLETVSLDLTPENSSDQLNYKITYGYESDSNRVNQITEDSGHKVSIEYVHLGGNDYRVASVRQGTGLAQSQTDFHYDLSNNITLMSHITNRDTNEGIVTELQYDDQQRLVKQTLPGVNGQTGVTTEYIYDNDDNITNVISSNGRQSSFRYVNGVMVERNENGRVTQWEFNDNHQISREVTFKTDPTTDQITPIATHYLYDEQQRLRFVVDALGQVQETRYTHESAFRQTISSISYLNQTFAAKPDSTLSNSQLSDSPLNNPTLSSQAFDDITLSALEQWVSTQADLQQSRRVDQRLSFDSRSSQVIRYNQVDKNGMGIIDDRHTETHFIYDTWGHLISQLDVTENEDSKGGFVKSSSHYAYDGLGRVIKTENALGYIETIEYDAANQRIVTRSAGGSVMVETFDDAGRLINISQWGEEPSNSTADPLARAEYHYDALGRLVGKTTLSGHTTQYIYNKRDQLVGEISENSRYTEYQYDERDRLVQTRIFATTVDGRLDATLNPSIITGFVDNNNQTTLLNVNLNSIVKPPASDDDRVSHFFYDEQDQLRFSVDAGGDIEEWIYDSRGLLIENRAYDQSLNVTPDAQVTLASLEQFLTVTYQDDAARSAVRTDQYGYNNLGQLVWQLDSENALTTFKYNAAGQLEQQVSVASRLTATELSLLAQNKFPPLSADDIQQQWRYDGRGRLQATINGEGYLTHYQYDSANDLSTTTRYIDPQHRITGELRESGDLNKWLAKLENSESRTTLSEYNALQQLVRVTDERNLATRFVYDADGRLVREILERPGQANERTQDSVRDGLGRIIEQNTTGADGLQRIEKNVFNHQNQVIVNTDPNGHQSWYFYNQLGQLTHQLDWAQNAAGQWHAEVKQLDYNAFGEQIAVTVYQQTIELQAFTAVNINGLSAGNYSQVRSSLSEHLTQQDLTRQTTHFQYNTDGQLESIVDPAGIESRRWYNSFDETIAIGQQTSLNSETFHFQTQEFNTVGSLIARSTYLNGQRSPFLSDSFPPDHFEGAALTVAYQYDAFRQLIAQNEGSNDGSNELTEVSNKTTHYHYDLSGNTILQIEDPEGVALFSQFAYNGAGDVIRVDQGGRSQRLDGKTGDILLSESEVLSSTIFQYNNQGQLIKEGQVLPSITETSSKTEWYNVTEYQYDTLGRLSGLFEMDGARTHYIYNSLDQVQFILTEVGTQINTDGKTLIEVSVSEYQYDSIGQQQLVTDYQQTVSLEDNNSFNKQLLEGVDSLNKVTLYDEFDRVKLTIASDGAVVEYSYDHSGNLVHEKRYATQQPALLQNLTRDLNNQKTPSITQSTLEFLKNNGTSVDDRVQVNFYDQNNRRVISIDGEGIVSRHQLNATGQVIGSVTYNESMKIGNLLLELGKGISEVTTLELTEKLDQLENPENHIKNHYLYDGAGRLILDVDGEGFVTYREYNALSQRVTEKRLANKLDLNSLQLNPVDVNSAVMSSGALTSETLSQLRFYSSIEGEPLLAFSDISDFRQSTFVYDSAGRLQQTINTSGDANVLVYDGLSQTLSSVEGLTKINSTAPIDDPILFRYANEEGRIIYMIDSDYRVYHLSWENDVPVKITLSASSIEQGDVESIENYYNLIVNGEYWSFLDDLVFRPLSNVIDSTTATTINDSDEIQFLLTGVKEYSAFDFTDARTTHFDYNDMNQLVAVTRQQSIENSIENSIESSIEQYRYDSQGRVLNSIDAMGNETRYFYDAYGRMTHVAKGVTRLEHDVTSGTNSPVTDYQVTSTQFDKITGKIASIQQHAHHIQLSIDDQGGNNQTIQSLLNLVDSSDDSIELYYYDDRNRIERHVTAKGLTTVFRYNAYGQIVETLKTGADYYALQQHTYDKRGFVKQTSLVDQHNTTLLQTEQSYDAYGRLFRQITGDSPGVSEQQGIRARQESRDPSSTYLTQTFSYNNNHQLVTSRTGQVTQLTQAYNAYGEVKIQIDGEGNRTTFEYDATAKKATRSFYGSGNERLYKTEQISNAFGEVVKTISATGLETDYHYDFSGNLIKIIEGPTSEHQGLRVTTRQYDKNNNLLTTQVDNNATRYEYDSLNRVVKEIKVSQENPSNHQVTEYGYNALGNQSYTTHPDGSTEHFYYDVDGHLEWQVINNQGQVEFVYQQRNANGQVVMTQQGQLLDFDTDPSVATQRISQQTEYQYDSAGQLLSEKTVNLETSTDGDYLTEITYQYNLMGQVIQTTNGLGHSERYFYNSIGQVEWVVSSDLSVTRTLYNNNGQPIVTIQFAEQADLSQPDWQRSFLSITDADRIEVLAYNEQSLLESRINSEGEAVRFDYNSDGQMIRRIELSNRLDLNQNIADILANNPDEYESLLRQVLNDNHQEIRQTDISLNSSHLITHTLYDHLGRANFTISAAGTVTQFVYNSRNQVVMAKTFAERINTSDAIGTSEIIEFLESHNPNQVRSSYQFYNSLGQKIFDIGPMGRVKETHYDALGRINGSTHYAIDIGVVSPNTSLDNIRDTLVDSDWRSERTFFDEQGNERMSLVLFEENGILRADVIEIRHSLIEQINNDGSIHYWQQRDTVAYAESIVFSENDTLESLTAKLSDGHYLSRQIERFDAVGNLREAIAFNQPNQSAAEQTSTSYFEYDSVGNLIQTTDPLGYNHYFQYDSQGRLVAEFKTSDHDQYEANGHTDQGYWTTFVYNSFGELIQNTQWLQKVNYSPAPMAQLSLASEQKITRYDYSENGQQTLDYVLDEQGSLLSATGYEYDAFGNKTSVHRLIEAPNFSHLTSSEFESLNDHIRAYSNLLQSQLEDPNKRLTEQRVYNQEQRLVAQYNRFNQVGNQDAVFFEYNSFGERVEIRHSNGQYTAFDYNQRGEKVAEKSGEWQPSTSAQDGDSRLYNVEQQVVTTRDFFGDIQIIQRQGSQASGSQFIFYNYRGQVEYQVDELGVITAFQYNTIGGEIEQIIYRTALDHDGLLNTELNAQRQQIESFLNDYQVSGSSVQITKKVLDGFGRTAKLYINSTQSADADILMRENQYNVLGQLIRTKDHNGQVSQYEYNGLGFQTATVKHLSTADAQGNTSYRYATEYNALGQVESTQVNQHLTGEFSSDYLGRQTKIVDATGKSIHYRYDLLGNLVEEITLAKSDHMVEDVFAQDSHTQQYKQERFFLYDQRGLQLISVSATGHIVLNEYDDRGNRVAIKQLATPSSTINSASLQSLQSRLYNEPTVAINLEQLESLLETHITLNDSDRFQRYDYDSFNRLIATHQIDVDYYERGTGWQTDQIITSTREYQTFNDGLVVITRNANGAETREYFDHKQRRVLVLSSQSDIESSGSASFKAVRYHYNALNQITQVTQFTRNANEKANTVDSIVIESGLDRHTYYEYDSLNRLSRTIADKNYSQETVSADSTAAAHAAAVNNSVSTQWSPVTGDVNFVLPPIHIFPTPIVIDPPTIDPPIIVIPPIVIDPPGGGDGDGDGGQTETITYISHRVVTEYTYKTDSSDQVIKQATYQESRDSSTSDFNVIGEVSMNEQQYDELGRVIHQSHYEQTTIDGVTQYSSDRLNTELHYDALNQLRREVQSNLAGQSRQQAYDYHEQQLTSSEGFREFVDYQYDSMGRVSLKTDRVTGSQISYQYDNNNQVIFAGYHDADGNKLLGEIYTYNAYGEAIQVGKVRAVPNVSNSAEQVWDIANALSFVVYEYDNNGRVTKSNQDGKMQWMAYDQQGNLSLTLTTQTTGVNHLTLADWLTDQSSDPQTLATIDLHLYDYNHQDQWVAHHQLQLKDTSISDLLHHIKLHDSQQHRMMDSSFYSVSTNSRRFNQFNQVQSITDAGGFTTEFKYNLAGHLTRKIQARTEQVSSHIDNSDHFGHSTVRSSSINAYTYDAQGRVITEIDGNGHLTEKQWDFDKLTEQTWFNDRDDPYRYTSRQETFNAFGDKTRTQIIAQDGSGTNRRTVAFDQHIHYQYGIEFGDDQSLYQAYTQKTQYTQGTTDDPWTHYQVESSVYDSAGRQLEKLQFKNYRSNGGHVDHQLQQALSNDRLLLIEEYGYDALGQINLVASYHSRQEQIEGITKALFWQKTEREYLPEINVSSNQAALYRETKITQRQGSQITQVNDYNISNQVIREQRTSTSDHQESSFVENNNYQYDNQGNLINQRNELGQLLKSYQYNSRGQRLSVMNWRTGDDASTGTSREYYRYDERGNRVLEISITDYQTDQESIRYKTSFYDELGRLSELAMYQGKWGNGEYEKASANADWSVSNRYDAQGNLTLQALQQGGFSEENIYVFDARNRVIANRQDGISQRITYDAQDRQIAIKNVNGSNQQARYFYRTDGKVSKSEFTNDETITTSYYVYDDEYHRVIGGTAGLEQDINAAIPEGVVTEELVNSNRFREQGQLVATFESVKDIGHEFGSVQKITINNYNKSAQKTGDNIYDFNGGINHITSLNHFDGYGNLIKTEQSIRTPNLSGSGYNNIYTFVETEHLYLDASRGKVSKIIIDAELKYELDSNGVPIASEEERDFIDSAYNALWDESYSEFSYGDNNTQAQVTEVKKYQVKRDIDNKVFKDILYGEGSFAQKQFALQIVFAPTVENTETNRYSYSVNGQVTQRTIETGAGQSPTEKNHYYYLNGFNLASQKGSGKISLASPQSSEFAAGVINDPRLTMSYRVQKGESLPLIAMKVYGDASLWYLIADANGLQMASPLIEGQSLHLPNLLQSAHHNSNTFEVYNPGDRLGNLNPVLGELHEIPEPPPPPPPPSTCEMVTTIVAVMVIAIAFTFLAAVTMGAASPLAALGIGIAIGAVEGAVTSLVVQGIEMAFGRREAGDIDWGAVGGSAAAGAVTGVFIGGSAARTSIQGIKAAGKGMSVGSRVLNNGFKVFDKGMDALRLTRFSNSSLTKGLVMGAASEATRQAVTMEINGNGTFDFIRFGTATVSGGLAVKASGGLRGDGGALRVGESWQRRLMSQTAIHSSISMGRSVTEHLAYGGSLMNMNWGAAALQAIGDGVTEAAANRVEQRVMTARTHLGNCFVHSTSFASKITQLTNESIGRRNNAHCFAAGTLIHTQDGMVPIEKISKRHRILTRNEHDPTASLEYRPILDHFVNPNKEVIRITVESELGVQESFVSTLGHPYFVVGKGWIAAAELLQQDELISLAGASVTVVNSETQPEPISVFNFEVPVDHTYFVGETKLWTHNTGCELVKERAPNAEIKEHPVNLESIATRLDKAKNNAVGQVKLEEVQHDAPMKDITFGALEASLLQKPEIKERFDIELRKVANKMHRELLDAMPGMEVNRNTLISDIERIKRELDALPETADEVRRELKRELKVKKGSRTRLSNRLEERKIYLREHDSDTMTGHFFNKVRNQGKVTNDALNKIFDTPYRTTKQSGSMPPGAKTGEGEYRTLQVDNPDYSSHRDIQVAAALSRIIKQHMDANDKKPTEVQLALAKDHNNESVVLASSNSNSDFLQHTLQNIHEVVKDNLNRLKGKDFNSMNKGEKDLLLDIVRVFDFDSLVAIRGEELTRTDNQTARSFIENILQRNVVVVNGNRHAEQNVNRYAESENSKIRDVEFIVGTKYRCSSCSAELGIVHKAEYETEEYFGSGTLYREHVGVEQHQRFIDRGEVELVFKKAERARTNSIRLGLLAEL